MTGTIFDVQRFSLHDGAGIRTTVFMKGCPLRCGWCHNPEGLSGELCAQFFEAECIGCNRCGGRHELAFAEKCPTGALKVSGEKIEEHQLLEKVLCDAEFYGDDGGVTFSGGECLLQADFVARMLQAVKENGFTTAVDTCGCVPWTSFEKTLPYCDTYLYDIKCADSALHKKYTGKSNELILENLQKLSDSGARIWLRVPVIPDVNDSDGEMAEIAKIAGKINAEKITLMPYHTLGKSKYKTLGLTPAYETEKMISGQRIAQLKKIFDGKDAVVE